MASPSQTSDSKTRDVWVPDQTSIHSVLDEKVLREAHQYLQFKGRHVHVVNSNITIKFGPRVLHYEYRVLQLLAKIGNGTVLYPRPLNFFTIADPRSEEVKREWCPKMQGDWNVIVMSTVPGKVIRWRISKPQHAPELYAKVLQEVEKEMERLNHAIERGVDFTNSEGVTAPLQVPTSAISDLDGKTCWQFPLAYDFVSGPVSIEDFPSTMAAASPQPSETVELQQSVLKYLCPKSIEGPYDVCKDDPNAIRFCHMDIHIGNILVRKGRLSGIIDWECAGWCTKALDAYVGFNHIHGRAGHDLRAIPCGIDQELIEVHASGRRKLIEGHEKWQAAQRRAEYESSKAQGLGCRRSRPSAARLEQAIETKGEDTDGIEAAIKHEV